MYRSGTEAHTDLARDPAFRKSKKTEYKLESSQMLGGRNAIRSGTTRNSESSTRDTAVDKDRSFLTISTGTVVEAETTPAILDVFRSCKVAFDNDVSTRPSSKYFATRRQPLAYLLQQAMTFRQLLDQLLADQANLIRAARDTTVPSVAEMIVMIPSVKLRLLQSCRSTARKGIAATIASDTTVDVDVKTLELRMQKSRDLDATGDYDNSQLFGLSCNQINLRGEQNLTGASVQLGRTEGFNKPEADLDDNLRFEIGSSGLNLEQSTTRSGDLRSQIIIDSFKCHSGSLSPVLMCVMAMSWHPHIQANMEPLSRLSKNDIVHLAISRIIEGVDKVENPQCLTSRFELLRHRDVPRINASSMTHVNVAAREDPGWLGLAFLRVAMNQQRLDDVKIGKYSASDFDIEMVAESNREAISSWRKQNLFRAMVNTIPYLQTSKAPGRSRRSEDRERKLISITVAALEVRLTDQRQGTQVDLFVFTVGNAVITCMEDVSPGPPRSARKNLYSDIGSCRIESHVYLLDRLQDIAPTVTDTVTYLKSPTAALKVNAVPKQPKKAAAWPYLAAVQIRDMVISAVATPLHVDIAVSDLQLMLKKNSTGGFAVPDMVNLNTAKTRARLLSVTPRYGASPAYLSLISLEFDKTRLSICDVRRRQQEGDPRASIVVHAGHVLVHTRATPHVMHSRIQEWLDDYKR